MGVHGLQGGVDVDKDDDYQVENGPNDAQHGQDALLLTFLVLDSLFLITVESVYHFLWKSLQFSSQTNLEQADKRKKRKDTIHISCRNWLIFLFEDWSLLSVWWTAIMAIKKNKSYLVVRWSVLKKTHN